MSCCRTGAAHLWNLESFLGGKVKESTHLFLPGHLNLGREPDKHLKINYHQMFFNEKTTA